MTGIGSIKVDRFTVSNNGEDWGPSICVFLPLSHVDDCAKIGVNTLRLELTPEQTVKLINSLIGELNDTVKPCPLYKPIKKPLTRGQNPP